MWLQRFLPVRSLSHGLVCRVLRHAPASVFTKYSPSVDQWAKLATSLLYDGLLGDAEAVWALLIGYLRLLGAAYADVVECIADGAAWIWKRVERLRTLAEIPPATLVEVLDFSHASQYLSETIATGRRMSKAQCRALSKRLRHALRHQADGVEVVMEALHALATTRRGKAITRALHYVETHAHRMRSVSLEARKLSIGSGQVESAVRRVINLRCKAPGSLWTETTVSGLMPLRAAFKAGQWDDVLIGVVTDTFQTPSFAPVCQAATHRSAEAQKHDTHQSFIKSRKQAASVAPFLPMHPSGSRLKTSSSKVAMARKLYRDRSISIPEICNTLHISKATLYRWVNTGGGNVAKP